VQTPIFDSLPNLFRSFSVYRGYPVYRNISHSMHTDCLGTRHCVRLAVTAVWSDYGDVCVSLVIDLIAKCYPSGSIHVLITLFGEQKYSCVFHNSMQ